MFPRIFSASGVYIFLFDPPPKYGQIISWGKKLLKENEKRGEYANFSSIRKKMHIFPPIDKKFTKLHKKILNIFHLRRAPRHYIKFHWGKNIIGDAVPVLRCWCAIETLDGVCLVLGEAVPVLRCWCAIEPLDGVRVVLGEAVPVL